MDAAAVIREIAERESFTPMGFWEYCQDIVKNPEVYAEDYLELREQELFGDTGLTFASVTRKAAEAAEGTPTQPPAPTQLYGHSVASVVRWMEREDWCYAEVKKVLKAKGIEIPKKKMMAMMESTGKIPHLQEAQINEMYSMLDE